MPATADALAAGVVSVDHVKLIASVHTPATEAAFVDAEPTLVDHARTMRFDDFAKVVRYWHQVVDPDGVERDAASRSAARRLTSRRPSTACGCSTGLFDGVAARSSPLLWERIERDLFKADWPRPRPSMAATGTWSSTSPARDLSGGPTP